MDNKKLQEIIIDLELSSVCNLSCEFCPRDKIKRSNPFLDLGIVDRLTTLIDGNHIVWFSGMGEPFLHLDLPEIVKRLKTSNSKVYTNTNASAPKFKEKLERAVKEGLDYVSVSVYGYDPESYQSTSRRDVFDMVVSNVKFLQTLPVNYRLSHVLTPEANREETRTKLEEVFGTNQIRLLQLHHRSYSSQEQESLRCALSQFYLFISSDGNVFSCVNDVGGENNFGKDLLKAAEEKRKGFPFANCKHCDEPHRTIPYNEGYFQKVFDLSSKQR